MHTQYTDAHQRTHKGKRAYTCVHDVCSLNGSCITARSDEVNNRSVIERAPDSATHSLQRTVTYHAAENCISDTCVAICTLRDGRRSLSSTEWMFPWRLAMLIAASVRNFRLYTSQLLQLDTVRPSDRKR